MMINAAYVSIGAYGFSSLEREYEKAMCADAYTIFTNFTDSSENLEEFREVSENKM